MKYLALILTLGALALASTATAGAGSAALCKNWQVAQSGSGASFSSLVACVKSKDVFVPVLSSSASRVNANEQYRVTGSGFHSYSTGTLAFSVLGYPPYYSVTSVTDASGAFVAILSFSACADSLFPVPLTLTYTDASGVHAQTGVVLC